MVPPVLCVDWIFHIRGRIVIMGATACWKKGKVMPEGPGRAGVVSVRISGLNGVEEGW